MQAEFPNFLPHLPPEPEAAAPHPPAHLVPTPEEASLIRALRRPPGPAGASLEAAVGRFEHWFLSLALARHQGCAREVARALGISTRCLYLHLARLGLDASHYRPHPATPHRTRRKREAKPAVTGRPSPGEG